MEEKNINPELEELKKNLNTAKGKLTTLEAKKKDLEKSTNDLVAKTIYQKKQDLERSYSEVLKEAEQRLKTIEKEKEEEKKKNLKKEIEHNTRGTKENNVFLNNEIKRILSENGIPGFVNSTLYMSIWSPSNTIEVIIGLVVAIIILLIPTAIVFFFYKDALIKTFPNNIVRCIMITLIYFAFIFVAGLIWLLVDKFTKKNPEALKEVKELRKNIHDNNNEIAKIKEDTVRNMSDDKYDYTKLDRDIEAGKLEVENYRKKQKDALEHFVNVTQDEITRAIEQEANKEKTIIENEMGAVKNDIQKLQKDFDDLKLKIAEN